MSFKIRSFLWRSLFLLQLLFFSTAYTQQLNHMEYGATNHAGQNPGFQTEKGFVGLLQSVQELLATHEHSGRIYLNDLDTRGLFQAGLFLKEYLLAKGIPARIQLQKNIEEALPRTGVEIVLVPGNYFEIPLPKTRTANLRNPAPMILHQLMYNSFTNPLGSKLGRMALHASEGLRVITRHIKKPFVDPDHPDDLQILQEDYSRNGFLSQSRRINETYHDFSVTGNSSHKWADGEILAGDYYEVLVIPYATHFCRQALRVN